MSDKIATKTALEMVANALNDKIENLSSIFENLIVEIPENTFEDPNNPGDYLDKIEISTNLADKLYDASYIKMGGVMYPRNDGMCRLHLDEGGPELCHNMIEGKEFDANDCTLEGIFGSGSISDDGWLTSWNFLGLIYSLQEDKYYLVGVVL